MSRQFEFEPLVRACRVCSATDAQREVGRERLLDCGQLLLRCGCCGLAYLAPDFTDEELNRFYVKDYRRLFTLEASGKPDRALEAFMSHVASERVKCFQSSIPSGGRVFELGSGFGAFLCALHSARSDVELTASEPDEAARLKFAAEVPVSFITTAEAAASGPFDVIFAFHVVEHLKAPVVALRQLRSALKPNGLLVIEVPDVMAPWSGWQDVHSAHLSYFSSESLSGVLVRAGYEVITSGYYDQVPALAGNLLTIARPNIGHEEVDQIRPNIAALDAHLAKYQWRRWDLVKRQIKRLIVEILGPDQLGRIQRRLRYARMY